MKPEDLDKLFNERLGNRTPMPSADLWNRLQNRMEEELPVKEEKKPIMMWARTYAAAAAVTVLLSVGVVFYNVQQEVVAPSEKIAQVEQPTTEDTKVEPLEADKWAEKSVAIAEEAPEAPATAAEGIAAVEIKENKAPETLPAQKAIKQVEKNQQKSVIKFDSKLVASKSSKKSKPALIVEQVEMLETPVAFASANANMNATPIEIIIKRAVTTSTPEVVFTEEPVSDFKKKKTLVKNIFKQVKNLSNGEQVNLEAVGLRADRIALETQIGKQKLSKVIHL